jgi:hypothetical protein
MASAGKRCEISQAVAKLRTILQVGMIVKIDEVTIFSDLVL